MDKRINNGGHKTAGRKSKFKEKTARITIQVPDGKQQYCKNVINRWIGKRFKK
jgi:hypothetical protein